MKSAKRETLENLKIALDKLNILQAFFEGVAIGSDGDCMDKYARIADDAATLVNKTIVSMYSSSVMIPEKRESE